MTPSSSSRSVYLIGIAGPTCSGKTTLAKHLARIIPSSSLLFQDDFAPPSELVPVHRVHGFQDWDDPQGAILWEKQRTAIKHLRTTGTIEGLDHYSHDHLNEQIPVPISRTVEEKWTKRFEDFFAAKGNEEKPSIVITEGFLMFYDEETVKEMDSRFFVREDYSTLKQRRQDRHGYHTAVQSDPEGSLWRDPPDYWDLCVWPAYLKAHSPLFTSQDPTTGPIDPNTLDGVVLLEAREKSMEEMVEVCLGEVWESLNRGGEGGEVGRERWRAP
ncbi:hypothetical protein JCM16303_002387 [Sporobolomyces ruberrimus]